MRKQALLGLLALLGICVCVQAAADRPATEEKSVVSRTDGGDASRASLAGLSEDPGIPAGVETPLLDPHTVFNRVIVGPDGKIIDAGPDSDDGSVAGPSEH